MSSYALITGASKGLGKSMATLLAERKYNLLLVARSEQELETLSRTLSHTYNVSVAYLAIDLSLPDSAQKVYEWCTHHAFNVSILINNAGYGLWGKFHEQSLESQFNMLQLNMQSLVALTYKMIPLLQQQKESYIMNVSSTAAYQAVPTLSLYAASKSFVLSFTRGLRHEWKNKGISVSCLCPGPINTGFIDRAGLTSIKATAERFGMHPDQVAAIAIKGMFRKKAEMVPGVVNYLSAMATRFFPKNMVENIAAGLYKKATPVTSASGTL
jgi:short-subunit dehydrogenase